jgi:hypothetical protein
MLSFTTSVKYLKYYKKRKMTEKKSTAKMPSANTRGETQQSNKPQQFRRQGLTESTKKESIPMLRYRKSNNFHRFKEALSQVAIRNIRSLRSID